MTDVPNGESPAPGIYSIAESQTSPRALETRGTVREYVIPGAEIADKATLLAGNTFGQTHQYGGPSAYFFGNLEGPMRPNRSC